MDNKTERVVWIDWAKSICMFTVILGHCHIHMDYQFVTQFIYSFHMMFFFFLSGILCKRDISFDSVKKDINYLLLPYFTFGILLIVFDSLRAGTFSLNLFLSKLYSLFLGDDPSIGPIWFLPALFICKQVFLIVMKSKQISRWLYFAFVLMSFLPVIYISSYQLNMPFFSDSALCGFPFFVVGHESCSLCEYLKKIKWHILLICSILLLVFSAFICRVNGFVCLADCVIGNSVFLYYINALFVIASVCMLCLSIDKNNSFVLTTSYGSIFTLFFQCIPLTFFNYYLPIILGYPISSYSLFLAFLYSISTYFICYFMIKYLDTHFPKFFLLRGNLRKL